ncbi:MAG: hypothetical protein DRP09_10575 [Candidatus Thorarchaeota archaeon]|nr:MAG: hypothetical protein DRP09_10575 [Candidatus Thorarchaeota archaeon]
MNLKRELEKMENRIKQLEKDIGIDNKAGKNIHFLLETIQIQANDNNMFQQQISILTEKINLLEEFIRKLDELENYQKFLEEKEKEQKKKAGILEFKKE